MGPWFMTAMPQYVIGGTVIRQGALGLPGIGVGSVRYEYPRKLQVYGFNTYPEETSEGSSARIYISSGKKSKR